MREPEVSWHRAVPEVAPPVPRVSFCFVGSQRLFSEVVLRTIETEFAGVTASRCPDMASWMLVHADPDPEVQLPLRLLIVDERLAEGLAQLLRGHDPMIDGVNIAIAVREVPDAVALMARWGTLFKAAGVSILPMNLNLNAWIQLIRLIDCGADYMPVSVYGAAPAGPVEGAAPNVVPLHAHGQGAMPGPLPGGARLTPREREVLALVAAGRPNKAIARELEVSAHTVKLHLHRIMVKLGVSNRTEAAVCYHHGEA